MAGLYCERTRVVCETFKLFQIVSFVEVFVEVDTARTESIQQWFKF